MGSLGSGHKRRTAIVVIVINIALLILIGRLFYLQILQNEKLSEGVKKIQKMKISSTTERGIIYDRNRKELAINMKTYTLYVRPKKIKDAVKVSRQLGRVLSKNPEQILKQIQSRKRLFTLSRKLSSEVYKNVLALGIKGVQLCPENSRFYPKETLGSHVIGFVSSDNRGLEGMERFFQDELKSKTNSYTTVKDARGRELVSSGSHIFDLSDGANIILTIDEIIQHILERELNKLVDEFSPKSITGIVMNPNTGEILAMANRPAYDPNNAGSSIPDCRRNRAVTDAYEPGSTFKIITAAAALDNKVFEPEDIIFAENGSYRFMRHTIHDHDPYGEITFRQALEVSSNIAFAKIGAKVGAEELYKYIRTFGFGVKMGIKLPGEANGLLRSLSRWSKLSVGVISFGQEVSVTPLQLITAISAVANGGNLMAPMIVSRMEDKNGKIKKEFKPRVVRRVISSKTSKTLSEILTGVVKSGTGINAQIKGYAIAGKTGTAQKYIQGKGYSSKKYVASFIGFLPVPNPQIAILIMVNEPQGAYYGSIVAAPAFKNVAQDVLRYLDVYPDEGERR
ncbi:penicillin-binding protein [bacterium]|nr:penicillin-binding protein [bacterium]